MAKRNKATGRRMKNALKNVVKGGQDQKSFDVKVDLTIDLVKEAANAELDGSDVELQAAPLQIDPVTTPPVEAEDFKDADIQNAMDVKMDGVNHAPDVDLDNIDDILAAAPEVEPSEAEYAKGTDKQNAMDMKVDRVKEAINADRKDSDTGRQATVLQVELSEPEVALNGKSRRRKAKKARDALKKPSKFRNLSAEAKVSTGSVSMNILDNLSTKEEKSVEVDVFNVDLSSQDLSSLPSEEVMKVGDARLLAPMEIAATSSDVRCQAMLSGIENGYVADGKGSEDKDKAVDKDKAEDADISDMNHFSQNLSSALDIPSILRSVCLRNECKNSDEAVTKGKSLDPDADMEIFEGSADSVTPTTLAQDTLASSFTPTPIFAPTHSVPTPSTLSTLPLDESANGGTPLSKDNADGISSSTYRTSDNLDMGPVNAMRRRREKKARNALKKAADNGEYNLCDVESSPSSTHSSSKVACSPPHDIPLGDSVHDATQASFSETNVATSTSLTQSCSETSADFGADISDNRDVSSLITSGQTSQANQHAVPSTPSSSDVNVCRSQNHPLQDKLEEPMESGVNGYGASVQPQEADATEGTANVEDISHAQIMLKFTQIFPLKLEESFYNVLETNGYTVESISQAKRNLSLRFECCIKEHVSLRTVIRPGKFSTAPLLTQAVLNELLSDLLRDNSIPPEQFDGSNGMAFI
ncbi:hypothetical protein BC829DRAFT_418786 [Chytridium lagenaria]|nr:hypothetical protein BC829DRAFT_418786 [Chytridium lagenaria]